MDDRELLELAAKAAGVEGEWCEFHGMEVGQDAFGVGNPRVHRWGDKLWNPLTDDGDALRLAATLGIHFQGHKSYPFCVAQYDLNGQSVWIKQENNGDIYAATRRAVVRAAAEIGRSMP